MYCLCISLVFQRHLATYLKEGILLIDPNLYQWRFMFLKAFVSAQKKSKPARITSTNILNHVTREESHFAQNVRTSLRLFAKMKKS